MSKFYPPIIEGKLPAFTFNNGTGIITIPFQMNRAVGIDDFGKKMTLLIKTVSTNITKATLTAQSTNVAILNAETNNYETQFAFSTTNFTPEVGQYYKFQLAYGMGTTLGYYSTVGVAKCTSAPSITIEGLNTSGTNNSKTSYVGQYQNDEIAEKVYSYRFIIKNSIGEIYDDSGWLLHNSSTDTSSTSSKDIWIPNKNLLQEENYTIQYKVQTLNNLFAESPLYSITEAITIIPPSFQGQLNAVLNKENGYIELFMTQLNTNLLNGKFILWRTSSEENFEIWSELIRCDMAKNKTMSIWKDFTIKQGVEYLYAFSIYNDSGLYSSKIYNIENRILADFEHMFLFDGKRQLKIAFNPKVSSFKTSLLETKTNTIGSQYPFFFRNGSVNYKEFPISGLLSILSDENRLFLSTTNYESLINRIGTPANNEISLQGYEIKNFANERNFKLEVLNWLNDGKPKLFRSPGEGNYIVRLMNSSLSPNDQLGRMLHTFSSTACEIAPFNLQSMKDCGLQPFKDNVINFKKKKVKMLLSAPTSPVSVNTTTNTVTISSPYAQKIKITNSLPTATITVTYNGYPATTEVFTIGASGQCLLYKENKLIKSLQFSSLTALSMSTLECEYEDTYTGDHLRNTTNVSIEIAEEYGVGHTSSGDPKNYWTSTANNQKGRCFYLKVQKRPIYYIDIIKINSSKYEYYYTGTTEVVDWEIGSFYITVVNQYNNKQLILDGSKPTYASTRPIASSLNYTFTIKGNCAPIDLTYEFTNGLISEKTFINIGEPTSLMMGNGLIFDSIYEIKKWG